MMKRGSALLIAALMFLLTAIPALGADVPYPDVSSDHWAYEAIERLHKAGLIEGYPDGTFGGERTFTRYEMAMVFDRILRRYDAHMESALADLGIDLDALTDEFGPELGLISALAGAISEAQREAKEAKAIAEAAADSADTAADRAYHARLTAEQALAEAKSANDTASMALALAGGEGADGTTLEEVRLAAQRAQRVAADAESAAMRANAVAEMAFAASQDSLEDTVEATRLAAQRAQRLAADAEAAALKAQAMAERAGTTGEAEVALGEVEEAADRAYRARLTAEQALALGQQADEKATRALSMSEIAMNDAASVSGVAKQALETARQADRLAYLAHLSAERALETAEGAHGRIDDLEERVAATPKITASLDADYEMAHTNDEGRLIDPRGAANGPKTYNRSAMTVGVGLGAAAEPREGVRVEGGIHFDAMVFGGNDGDVDLSDLYAQVTTDGLIRKVYFGSLTGDTVADGFHKYTLSSATYEDRINLSGAPNPHENRAGVFADFQAGKLATRVVASKTDTPDEFVYGVATSLPLAEGMNVGFSAFQGHDNTESPAIAFSLNGEASGLTYDWVTAKFHDDTAVDASVGTTFGEVTVDFAYQSVGEAFATATADYYGKGLTYKDDGIEAGRKRSLLEIGAPVFGLDLGYEKGRDSDLDGDEFKDWHKIGFTDADVLGFGLSAHYYVDEIENSTITEGKTAAYRIGLDRTVSIGLPLTFSFVYADIGLTNYAGIANDPNWESKTHQAFGVAVEEHALSETLTVDAGYKLERNAIGDDWTDAAAWDVALRDDTTAAPAAPWGYVKDRTTLHAKADFAVAEGLTLSGGYKRVDNDANNGNVVMATTDLGAEYNVDIYGTDVTLGYGWQNVKAVVAQGNFTYADSPRSTYSVDASRDAWGGTLEAGYKFVTGRGSDAASKVEARDMTAHIDYSYPVADGMDFTLGGKWTNSEKNDPIATDYYFSSVKAGFAIKF